MSGVTVYAIIEYIWIKGGDMYVYSRIFRRLSVRLGQFLRQLPLLQKLELLQQLALLQDLALLRLVLSNA